jgi:hypothetical protein
MCYNGNYYSQYHWADLVSPKVKLDPDMQYTLSFYVYMGYPSSSAVLPTLVVSQSLNDDPYEELITIDVTEGEPGWQLFEIPLTGTQLANFAKICFRGYMSTMSERIWLDNVRITAVETPSAVNELMGWTELTEEEAAKLPSTVSTLVRLAAHTAGTDTIYSNTVALTLVPSLVVAPSFPEFIYMMGNFNSWTDPVALRSPAMDGIYSCFNWLDGGFKFRPNEGNWDGDWGQDPAGPFGKLVVDGEEDCNDAGKSFPDQAQPAGFFKIDVDMTTMTWSITPITSVSIIGGFNGWGDDVEMTYNAGGYWEVTTDKAEGEFKFRANHDWAINWGGTPGALTQDGPNLSLEAGTYTFKLYLTHEGNSHVEITQ